MPVAVHQADVEWAEIIPGASLDAVYGDWQEEAHGKLIRFAPGVETPMHMHSDTYRGVVVSGRVTNPYQGEADPPELGPGDYWYVPGGAPHTTACISDEPCLFYTYGDDAWDIAVVE